MKKYSKQILCWMLILIMALTVACSSNNNQGKADAEKKTEKTEPVVVKLAGGDFGLSQPYTTYSRGPGTYKVKTFRQSRFSGGFPVKEQCLQGVQEYGAG